MHNRLFLYRLQDISLLCELSESVHICDSSQRAIGPIPLDNESEESTQPYFFFAEREPLQTERFEFHKSKSSPVSSTSYIYMLHMQQNVELEQLDDYLDTVVSN